MNYYASFGQRFCAALIDAFVIIPILVGVALLSFDSVWVTSLVMIGAMFAIVFYPIVGHAKFGKTIGKHAMGIRVVAVDGNPIGWKQAWLRSSVDVGFVLIGAVETDVALFECTTRIWDRCLSRSDRARRSCPRGSIGRRESGRQAKSW